VHVLFKCLRKASGMVETKQEDEDDDEEENSKLSLLCLYTAICVTDLIQRHVLVELEENMREGMKMMMNRPLYEG
jgi:hypothetical protein